MTKATRRHDRRQLVGIIFIVLLAAMSAVLLSKPEIGPLASNGECPTKNLTTFDANVHLLPGSPKTFNLEYSKTAVKQEVGLSGRPCIPENGALLFFFPTDDRFGIWMKGMKFPIDVVWLDSNKKIVWIEKNMQPESYPKVYYPDQNARYVLEFSTGAVEKLGAQVGSTLNW